MSWIESRATRLRETFDGRSGKRPAVAVVTGSAVLAAAAAFLVQRQARGSCDALPFSVLDLELSFSAKAFTSMIRAARHCGSGVVWTLVTSDVLFPLAYAVLLSALYLWGERYLRFPPNPGEGSARSQPEPDGASPTALSPPGPLPLLTSILVLLPFAAAILDVLAENVPLFLAARGVSASTSAAPSLVLIGSIGAALKWTLVAASVLGVLGVFLSGPRGLVLWRLRYSVLAVAVGALALLAVPQGQDILQRLVDGAYAFRRIVFAVVALTGSGLVVWYTGRVLTLVRLSGDRGDDGWRHFFERHIPRMLGVTVLALAGWAFARAGLAAFRFAIVVAVAYAVSAMLVRVRGGAPLRAAGTWLVPKALRGDARLRERAGRVVLASLLGAAIVWPATFRPVVWGYDLASMDLRQLRTGAWLTLIAAWALYLFVYYRRDLLEVRRARRAQKQPDAAPSLQRELVEGYAPDSLPRAARTAGVVAGLVSAALLILFTFRAVAAGRLFGPLIVLSLAVSNAVFMGSLLAYAGRKYRLPLVAILLAMAAVFSRWNDNHGIRIVSGTESLNTAQRTGALRTRFDGWLRRRAAEDSGNIPVVLVAAAGGGLRAAYWTAVSLATLQDRDSSGAFARHVFAISTVSGGSLGGALFTALARDLRDSAAHAPCTDPARSTPDAAQLRAGPEIPFTRPTLRCAREYLTGDFLSPVLAKMLAPDFLQWFVPFPIPWFDRATALEGSWERSYETTLGRPTFSEGYLRLTASDSAAPDSPLLLLNTAHVQTGRRYVTAPFVDDSAFLDSRSVHRALGADLPLSVAVHNSARFPYVSPAGRIERRDGVSYGALVDGGYFENSGLTTLDDVRRVVDAALQDERGSADTAIRAVAQRASIVVLYLCNDPIPCRRDLAADSVLATQRGIAAEWFSPLHALLATRDARGTFARSHVQHQPRTTFLQLNVCDSLTVRGESATDSSQLKVGHERVVSPPLGWLLSRMARDWMDSSLTPGVPVTALAGSPLRCRERNVRGLDSLRAMMPPRRTGA